MLDEATAGDGGTFPTLEEALEMVQAQVDEPADEKETPAATEDEAAASEEDATAAGEDTETGEETAPAKGRSSVLQKLIDSKYGGDEDKFAAGLYELQNSSAALRQELVELKQSLKQPQQDEQPEIQHPDIPWLDKRETALKGKIQANEAERGALLTKLVDQKAKIDRAQGRLEATDDPDRKLQIQAEIDRLDDRKEKQQERWQSLGEALQRDEVEIEAIVRQRQFAEQQVSQFKAQQQKRAVEDRKFEAETLDTFVQAVDAQVKRYGLQKNSPEADYMEGVFKAELITHLDSLPEGAEAVDIADFVKQRAVAFARVAKLGNPKVQNASAKLQAARPAVSQTRLSPEASTAVKQPLKGLTAEQARLRARKILGM